MALAEKLKKGRADKNLSQADVANQLNISRQSISKWENGYNYPDMDNLVLLSKIYDISIDDLLNEKEAKEVNKGIQNVSSKAPKIEKVIIEKTVIVKSDEGLLLLIIALISSILTPLGIIIAGVIIHRNKKENTYYKTINTIAVFSILINIYFTYSFVTDWFGSGIQNDVQLVE